MLQTIIKSIRDREVLGFVYNGFARVVEPHAVGISITGNSVLWCFQTQGGGVAQSQIAFDHVMLGYEWDLFELSQIANLHSTGRHFVGERYGYKRGNRHMASIFAEL